MSGECEEHAEAATKLRTNAANLDQQGAELVAGKPEPYGGLTLGGFAQLADTTTTSQSTLMRKRAAEIQSITDRDDEAGKQINSAQ